MLVWASGFVCYVLGLVFGRVCFAGVLISVISVDGCLWWVWFRFCGGCSDLVFGLVRVCGGWMLVAWWWFWILRVFVLWVILVFGLVSG